MFNERDWNIAFGILGAACALGGGAFVGLLWWWLG